MARKPIYNHRHHGVPGLIMERRNRKTGLMVGLYYGPDAGIPEEDGGAWVAICEPHGYLMQATNRGDARDLMAHTPDWCEVCHQFMALKDRFGDPGQRNEAALRMVYNGSLFDEEELKRMAEPASNS